MAKLTAKARNALPASQFALPGGRYPVENPSHAANAKARASQQFNAGNLSASQKATVDAKANKVVGKAHKTMPAPMSKQMKSMGAAKKMAAF